MSSIPCNPEMGMGMGMHIFPGPAKDPAWVLHSVAWMGSLL